MVQIHLGHRSLSATQRYTHVSQQGWRSKSGRGLGFFRGEKEMMEMDEMNEFGHELSGAARIWTGVTDSQSP